MYSDPQTHFRDVPVSVTMEDDAKNSRDGNSNTDNEGTGNGSDTDHDQEQQGGARLLQVTMAEADPETAKEESVAVATEPEIKEKTIKAAPSDSIGSAEDEYVLQPPSSVSNDKSLENQIERDFQDLSEIERQQVYFDMRGEIFKAEPKTTSGSPDTPFPPTEGASKAITAPVSELDLEALNTELLRLLETPEEQQKNPFYQSIFKTISSSDSDFYANTPALRSKLLRAEHNNVQKAAKRTADFFSLLCELFGEKLLSRPIKLSDLSAAERQLQRKGYQQLFRFRDQSECRKSSSSSQEGERNNLEQQKQELLQGLDSGAGRRIAGSFDLCRCISTTEPAIDDETAKVRMTTLFSSFVWNLIYLSLSNTLFHLSFKTDSSVALSDASCFRRRRNTNARDCLHFYASFACCPKFPSDIMSSCDIIDSNKRVSTSRIINVIATANGK